MQYREPAEPAGSVEKVEEINLMTPLEEYTTTELKKELQRRKQASRSYGITRRTSRKKSNHYME